MDSDINQPQDVGPFGQRYKVWVEEKPDGERIEWRIPVFYGSNDFSFMARQYHDNRWMEYAD